MNDSEHCIDCDKPLPACSCENRLRCSCGIPDAVCICAGKIRNLVEEPFVPAEQLQWVVRLTDAERERILWWLHRPVPPGPMKALDVAIIRKLGGQ